MEADVINLYQSRTTCHCGRVAKVFWVHSYFSILGRTGVMFL